MTTLNNTQVQSQAQVDTRLAAAFPPGFLWGSATASYQIEGATHEDGRSLSIWDQFAATPGKTFQGDTGDIADDHYHRMPQDVALMAELGLGAYRFSLAWPRILPQGRGKVNSPGLDFYDRLVDTLLAHGIKPFATLYHWDLPIALEEKGGWVNRDTAYAFAEYAEVTARRLGDRVEAWITLNEPWCSAFLGYGIGVHAPGLQNRQAAFDAGHNLLLAHGLAVPRIRASIRPGAQVGITLNFTPQYAADERPETLRAIERADAFSNRWFLDPIYRGSYPDNLFSGFQVNPPPVQEGDFAIITAPIDFLGVNYYSRSLMQSKLTSGSSGSENHENSESGEHHEGAEAVRPVPGSIYTEMGWEVYPQGLSDLLVRLHREYAIPALYVTENGAAFADQWNGEDHVSDPLRVEYLHAHIQAQARAIAAGVPLRGYFVWSLLDNFEWGEGYSKRFGIVYVDYPTQRRILKDSALWYKDFIAAYHRQQGK
jgi:beta-glucosidase